MTSIYWLIAFVVLTGIEVATMALTTIWFAGGAIVAFVVSLCGAGVEIQLAVFVIVSFLLLFLTRPFAAKYVNSGTVKTNAEGLVGRQARVVVEVNNQMETGQAVIDGQEWTARALRDADVYPEGTTATIKEIRGVKLILGREDGGME